MWGKRESVLILRSAQLSQANLPLTPRVISVSIETESTYRLVATLKSQVESYAPVALVSIRNAQAIVNARSRR